MSSPSSIFHAFLRPSILQILRATGYHSTRPSVLDSLTDLAARYLLLLCEKTAGNALNNHGDPGDFDVVDIRLALQEVGALPPEKVSLGKPSRKFQEQRSGSEGQDEEDGEEEEEAEEEEEEEEEEDEHEDLRGVEEFIQWFSGARMKEMMQMGSGDGESDATDYLTVLKKKHSKTGDDAKWQGTIFGRCHDSTGEILVEGGLVTSIEEWIASRKPTMRPGLANVPAIDQDPGRHENGGQGAEEDDRNGTHSQNHDEDDGGDENGDKMDDGGSRQLSSGLSSVGDRIGEDEMDLT
ncbi:Transcription initiation factor TFIID subunit 3 [Escovopsis weberi]|uniref:Transcription initiation factor TFIID subunit 3 n=1 Tax=Escovopsis weberi TaxID=150374 RepID=A0A0M8MRJ2_ESCWE|nr:Transcription initiation factor TFIID subunit 3 [Escovopsis weberi]